MSALATKVKPEFLKENNKEQLDKYQCPRCRYLLKDAVQTSCGHWLCNDCAEHLFEANSTPNCPREDCGETLTNENGRPFFPDRFVRKEISKFNMICLNAKHGCPWSGQIGQLFDHLLMCQYDKQDCPHCQESFSSSEYFKDKAVESEINLLLFDCPKCQWSGPIVEHKRHLIKNHDVRRECEKCLQDYSIYSEKEHQLTCCAAALCDSQKLLDGLYLRPVEAAVITDRQMNDWHMLEIEKQISQQAKEISHLSFLVSTLFEERESLKQQLDERKNTSYNGKFIWKIQNMKTKLQQTMPFYSPPFFTSYHGYKLCLSASFDGSSGSGHGTHFSVGFHQMEGDFDEILAPFQQSINSLSIQLYNRNSSNDDILGSFGPSILKSDMYRPADNDRFTFSCPDFAPLSIFSGSDFVKDDVTFMKCIVDLEAP